MNFLFLMDPLNTVQMNKDTTFCLMLAAHKRKHKIFYLAKNGLTRRNGKMEFHVTPVIPQRVKGKLFIEQREIILTERDADCVFVRTDPPFDQEYLMHTWLLDLLPKSIAVINSPNGIRTVNEKVWVSQFTSIIPPTLITRNREDILKFLKDCVDVVAKPTDGHGGKSIFHVRAKDHNAKVILETLTHQWSREIVLQKFVKEAANGDKRILLLNGEPLGAVLRLHSEDDHRNNFFSGGAPIKAKVTAQDLKMIEEIKPHLKRLGLYFVGIDLLGKFLIEVNVTSPTCLQEMIRFDAKAYDEKVIAFAENLVDQKRS